jgi:hypothetical protein
MASVNQTRPHCVNQIGKTHSKPSAARHGRGTAWARYAMCESALNLPPYDEALKNSTLGTSMSSYLSIVLIKGVALPSTILESKTHAWHFLLAVHIGFEFILIQIRKRVV